MVWVVEPRELRDALGVGCGVWRLVASNDDTGEAFAGCCHDHRSTQEAIDCSDAQMIVRAVTSAPRLHPPEPRRRVE